MGYDKVRVSDASSDACERFLSLFESAVCRMVEMSCTQHDVYAANSQFLTHLVGRMLGSVGDLRSTPIDTKGFASKCVKNWELAAYTSCCVQDISTIRQPADSKRDKNR